MKISKLIQVLEWQEELYGDIEVYIDLDVGDDMVPTRQIIYNEASDTGLPPNTLILQS